MVCSLKLACVSVSGSNETLLKPKTAKQYSPSLQFQDVLKKDKELMDLNCRFMGQSLVVSDQKSQGFLHPHSPANFSVQPQASLCVSKALRWWEKTWKPNMIEIHSAQEFVDTLKSAGDRLVIVDFYSPGCGGCKSLHPKICQLAESNPDAAFLKVNYEELKPMCHALNIHVLPFFRFYRGPQGRVCSFSCTISTIKKFKDALAKQGSERCNLGAAKGLEESEILKLTSIGELPLNPARSALTKEDEFKQLFLESMTGRKVEAKEEISAIFIA